MINIDELIKDALKSKDADKLKAYRNLKAKIMEYKTAKNAKPYDNQAEIQIIKKMCDLIRLIRSMFNMIFLHHIQYLRSFSCFFRSFPKSNK